MEFSIDDAMTLVFEKRNSTKEFKTLPVSDPDGSRKAGLYLGIFLSELLGMIFVLARLYTKCFLNHSWGHDDTLLAIAFLLSIGLTILFYMGSTWGIGTHWSSIDTPSRTLIMEAYFVENIVYFFIMGLTKISICFFYRRIFQDRLSRILADSTSVFIIIYTIPFICLNIFTCNPISAAWTHGGSDYPDHCHSMTNLFVGFPTCNMAVDIWMIAIVVPRILPLRLARRQKIALVLIVSSGWIVLISSILRLVKYKQSLSDSDFSWNQPAIQIWTAIEINVGFFCISAPAVRPILERIAPSFMRSLSSTRQQTYTDNRYGNATYTGAGTKSLTGGKGDYGLGSRVGSERRHPNIAGAFELHDTYITSESPVDNKRNLKDGSGSISDESQGSYSPHGLPLQEKNGGIMTSTSVAIVSERAAAQESASMNSLERGGVHSEEHLVRDPARSRPFVRQDTFELSRRNMI